MEFYKKKYCIGVYAPKSEGETLIALLDNISEFAKFMNIRRDNASEILRLLFNKKCSHLRYKNKLCTVEFIDMLLEEDYDCE